MMHVIISMRFDADPDIRLAASRNATSSCRFNYISHTFNDYCCYLCRKMRFVIIFSVSLLILLKKTVWCIPLNEFYPFGVRENDLQLQRGDDISSPEISLPSAFPFYDQNFQTIFVSYS